MVEAPAVAAAAAASARSLPAGAAEDEDEEVVVEEAFPGVASKDGDVGGALSAEDARKKAEGEKAEEAESAPTASPPTPLLLFLSAVATREAAPRSSAAMIRSKVEEEEDEDDEEEEVEEGSDLPSLCIPPEAAFRIQSSNSATIAASDARDSSEPRWGETAEWLGDRGLTLLCARPLPPSPAAETARRVEKGSTSPEANRSMASRSLGDDA